MEAIEGSFLSSPSTLIEFLPRSPAPKRHRPSSISLSLSELRRGKKRTREMLGRRLASLSPLSSKSTFLRSLHRSFFSVSSEQQARSGSKESSFRRKAIPIVLLSLTGGVALSALNDLAIFHGCSSKAIEKARQNQKVIEALGEPIVRGPWYDASLAVGHRRHSVSCTFPVSGPQGSGTFQLKAVRSGEDTWFSFLRHNDWDILILEALLHAPSTDEKDATYLRISLMDDATPTTTPARCISCTTSNPGTSDN